jgi:hypothetical protein
MAESYYCEKCNRTLVESSFYTSNNREKYPNGGKLHQCKKCITMHVDNWDPSTYLWILEEIDIPYVPKEWHKILNKIVAKQDEITSSNVLGKYIANMKLKQFKNYRWKDTEYLQQLENAKIEETMRRTGYDQQQIDAAITQNVITMPEKPDYVREAEAAAAADSFSPVEDDSPAFDVDLTEEDKIYLRLKWGKNYRPSEWVQLEQLYEEMMNSYDIQSAGHIDTLKLLCKTSLKANQLIDIGDVEGFQKMQKAYDSLMKSGKFTAVQNKEAASEDIDCIGALVAICEKEGFIPRYYVDTPNDKIDKVILDLQNYTKSLVQGESNLSNMFENALQAIERDRMNESIIDTNDLADEDFEEQLFSDDAVSSLNLSDYEAFQDYEDDLEQSNDEFFNGLESE